MKTISKKYQLPYRLDMIYLYVVFVVMPMQEFFYDKENKNAEYY